MCSIACAHIHLHLTCIIFILHETSYWCFTSHLLNLCMKMPLFSTASLETTSEKKIGTGRQQKDNLLYCGYCNHQCKTTADLVKHCKQNSHKYAVFADCGRDVFWQFKPPPLEKEHISTALHR